MLLFIKNKILIENKLNNINIKTILNNNIYLFKK